MPLGNQSPHIAFVRPSGSNAISPFDRLLQDLIEDTLSADFRVTLITGSDAEGSGTQLVKRFDTHPRFSTSYVSRLSKRYTNQFSRFYGEISFMWRCVQRVSALPEVNLCFIPSSPTLGAGVILLAGKSGRQLIYNLQDIFPDCAVNSGIMPGWSARLFTGIERVAYRKADGISVIGEEMRMNILAKGALPAKVRVIPNWVDTDAVREVSADKNRFYRKHDLPQSAFYVVYAGNMGYAQNVSIVVECAHLLKDHKGIEFLLIGDGQRRSALEAQVRKYDLRNVRFFPFEPLDMVPDVYSAGHIDIVSLMPGLSSNAVPSKTCAIMACARPVLAAVDRDSGFFDFVNDNAIGIAVGCQEADLLAEGVLKLYQDRTLANSYGLNGRAYVEQHLSRRVCTAQHIRMFRDIVEGRFQTANE